MTKRTVILIWKQWYHNAHIHRETAWGVGDLLRGAYGMFLLSKSMGFRLIVDFSLHPIREFLQVTEHEHSVLVHEKRDSVPYVEALWDISKVAQFIEHDDSDVLLIFSTFGTAVYDNHVTHPELQDFIRTVLTPTKEFQEYINANLEKLPTGPYSILHYRLGDDELVHNSEQKHTNKLYTSHVLTNKLDTDILFSDSYSLKNAVRCQDCNVLMFNEPICHIGYSTDKSEVRQTLFELFVLMKASSVRSYSVYGWTSGFVKAICTVYNIPLQSVCNFRG